MLVTVNVVLVLVMYSVYLGGITNVVNSKCSTCFGHVLCLFRWYY